MDLKNMTMDDLKQKLSGVDKKILIKFGVGVGAVVLFLISSSLCLAVNLFTCDVPVFPANTKPFFVNLDP